MQEVFKHLNSKKSPRKNSDKDGRKQASRPNEEKRLADIFAPRTDPSISLAAQTIIHGDPLPKANIPVETTESEETVEQFIREQLQLV